MVGASIASNFWAAVEDCLATFHGLPRCAAAKKVTDLWRRLPKNSDQPCDGPSFEDMIYHAEPWYIAWNRAGKSIELAGKRLDANRTAYQDIVKKNGLA